MELRSLKINEKTECGYRKGFSNQKERKHLRVVIYFISLFVLEKKKV